MHGIADIKLRVPLRDAHVFPISATLTALRQEHNPNNPSRLSPDAAAIILQTHVRARNARQLVQARRTAKQQAKAEAIEVRHPTFSCPCQRRLPLSSVCD